MKELSERDLFRRLERACECTAAGTDRALFHELNPELPHSPILKSLPAEPRPAAGLVPVLLREEGPAVLFTVRSTSMPSHAGEISFPGGGPRSEEETRIETALREAHEEVGIEPDHVRVAGSLGVHLGGLGYAVTPVVGLIADPPTLRPCDREVSDVFEVPLDFVVGSDNHTVIDRKLRGISYRMRAMPWQDPALGEERLVWGLTAGIVHSFAAAWHDADPTAF